jgi:hypothetical protein
MMWALVIIVGTMNPQPEIHYRYDDQADCIETMKALQEKKVNCTCIKIKGK